MGGTSDDGRDSSFTVSQLTGIIKTLLENSLPQVTVKGEISNFKPSSAGHCYFVLKDSEAQINAVMFRGRAQALGFQPKDGMLVEARGSISVYPGRGAYQIIVSGMSVTGDGDIMAMIEERKRRLAQEGLFDSARKKRLPFFPRTLGVVTSPNGAALRDILQIVRRRNTKVSVIIFPAVVQGSEAAASIVSQIQAANLWSLCDVLIVGRGGGSLEDLLPFSEESVVRAIAGSGIPVISAVGHEIDWALSDFAADVRAPTPSAAAEIAVPLLEDITGAVTEYRQGLESAMRARTESLRLMLRAFSTEGMELKLRQILNPLIMRFDSLREALIEGAGTLISSRRERISQMVQILESCNPQAVLSRGYSMVTDADGKVIRDASTLKDGERIIIRPARGVIEASVSGVRE